MGIQSKEDYFRYLEADRRALNKPATRPKFFGDEVWKFERLLRRVEYYENCKRAWYNSPARVYLSVKFRLYSLLLGFTIPQHVFGPGLSIANRGTIVVNSCARVGANCRLHICVNIGSRAGTNTEAPIIGDNVYIGPGVVMFGLITIADNIAIGANSVVTKSFSEPDITIVGAPARKISDIGTSRFTGPACSPFEQNPDAGRGSQYGGA
jgi:serine O-acetyltransferase